MHQRFAYDLAWRACKPAAKHELLDGALKRKEQKQQQPRECDFATWRPDEVERDVACPVRVHGHRDGNEHGERRQMRDEPQARAVQHATRLRPDAPHESA